jgi:membrane-associated protease RseP (regulator of RpoE activity)
MRALGRPVGNLLLGAGALLLNTVTGPNHYLVLLMVVNFVFFAASGAPLPGLDGGSVLHELRHWRSTRE